MVNLCAAGFDQSLASIVGKISQNQSLRKLCIGRNLAGIKQRYPLSFVLVFIFLSVLFLGFLLIPVSFSLR